MDNDSYINKFETAIIAVSPISRHANYIVSAPGDGCRDVLELKVFKFDPKCPDNFLVPQACVKTSVAFTSLAWTKFGEDTDDYPLGLLIGGHQDGTVTLWDPTQIIFKETKKTNQGLVAKERFVSSKINDIKVNAKQHLFAISSKQIYIISINFTRSPPSLSMSVAVKCPPNPNEEEITSLSWNDKVSHILAAGSTNGMTYIWDMKKVELFLTLFDRALINKIEEEEANNMSLEVSTKVQWCPDGAQILIAFDDPDYNFMSQYHMKQPRAPTAEYHGGHSRPIVEIVKNFNDTNFFLSLGKDNQAICWSMKTHKPIANIQLGGKTSQVAWLTKFPDVFVSVGYDGELHVHRINFANDIGHYNFGATKGSDIPPNWLGKRVVMNFSFGGRLVSYANNQTGMNLFCIKKDKNSTKVIRNFLDKVEKTDLSQIFDEKIAEYSNSNKISNLALFWVTMKCLYTNNFNELYRHLGYDKGKLESEINQALGKKNKSSTKNYSNDMSSNVILDEDPEEIFKQFSMKAEKVVDNVTYLKENLEKPSTVKETVTLNINWNVGTEKLIKQSLLIGEMEAAVELAFKAGRNAEALLIASCDFELFNKAKQVYLNNSKDLFIKTILPAILDKNFTGLFDNNITKEWREYILYAKTYLNEEDCRNFVTTLGDKLLSTSDLYSSVVCYVLAGEYSKCLDLIYESYAGKNGKERQSLQNVFEQIVIMSKVLGSQEINPVYNKIVCDYCLYLIEEGLFVEASSYLMNIKDENKKVMELYDRIYYHIGKGNANFAKPNNPYNILHVKVKERQIETKHLPGIRKPVTTSLNANNGINSTSSHFTDTKQNYNLYRQPVVEQKETAPKQIERTPQVSRPLDRAGRTMTSNTREATRDKSPVAGEYLSKSRPPVERTNKDVTPSQQPVSKTTEDVPSAKTYMNNEQTNTITGNTVKTPRLIKPINPPKPNVIFSPTPSTELSQGGQPSTSNSTSISSNQNQIESPPKERTSSSTATPPSLGPRLPHPPKNVGPIVDKVSANMLTPKPKVKVVHTPEEEHVMNFISGFTDLYNATYTDDIKQRDFASKISIMTNKMNGHEVKTNLLQLIIEFSNMYDSGASLADLKKMYVRIQSTEWDKNKTWVTILERIMNLKK